MSTRLGDTGPNPVSTPSPVNWSVSRPAVNPARLFRVRMAQNRLSEAEELLSQLGEGSTFTEEDNNSTENELLRLAALLSWARGDVAQAENQLRAAFSQGGFSFNIEGFPADFSDLLRSLEKHQPAQDEYQRILTLNPNYPPAVYGLAILFASTDRPGEAERYYTRFLELWQDADPDLPELKRARQALGH